MQCIASWYAFGLRMTVERAESLSRHFEVVPVLPPTEEEAIRMVAGVKEQYEKFHGVAITNEAIETAIAASRWFLRHRNLPDRAIDLIDDAGAWVKLRSEREPPDGSRNQKTTPYGRSVDGKRHREPPVRGSPRLFGGGTQGAAEPATPA